MGKTGSQYRSLDEVNERQRSTWNSYGEQTELVERGLLDREQQIQRLTGAEGAREITRRRRAVSRAGGIPRTTYGAMVVSV